MPVHEVPFTCSAIDDCINLCNEIKENLKQGNNDEVIYCTDNLMVELENLRTENSRLRDNWYHEQEAMKELTGFASDLEIKISELQQMIEEQDNKIMNLELTLEQII